MREFTHYDHNQNAVARIERIAMGRMLVNDETGECMVESFHRRESFSGTFEECRRKRIEWARALDPTGIPLLGASGVSRSLPEFIERPLSRGFFLYVRLQKASESLD